MWLNLAELSMKGGGFSLQVGTDLKKETTAL